MNTDAAAAMQSIANSTGAAKSLGCGSAASTPPTRAAVPGPACAATERAASSPPPTPPPAAGLQAAPPAAAAPRPPHPRPPLQQAPRNPRRLLRVPALEMFAVDDNDMSESMVLPDDMVACPRIQSFSASNVNMDGISPDFFGNASLFPDLESLSLARNQLWGAIRPDFGMNSTAMAVGALGSKY
ncbi:hypothetical protein C2845_PM02G01960 [Panicum miliaceum]|uniref:Uncharacterized protein n=1 Tax=Panicum miliaceum TaxID=4540 RepID=A0A3L6S3W7_PANMI|nr:hypothetical protein C2845_PM02G01960 [Panicum miliaceum]